MPGWLRFTLEGAMTLAIALFAAAVAAGMVLLFGVAWAIIALIILGFLVGQFTARDMEGAFLTAFIYFFLAVGFVVGVIARLATSGGQS